tara:strand:- start:2780 stop:3220 length:441 start_codon:yes stop_codon:yes gene_type:complete
MKTILLERNAHFDFGTFGEMVGPSGFRYYTVERPWVNNEPMVSCIPEGTYTLRQRKSGVVTRSSGGKFTSGWEVTNVSGRTFIMIHPANWPSQLHGCIAVGLKLAPMQDPKGKSFMGVQSSRKAFTDLMKVLGDEAQEWQLIIRSK